MKKLCMVAAAALFVLGCGKDDDYRKNPGNNGAVQPEKGKTAKTPDAEIFVWPEGTFAEVKGSLSTGANVYNEKRVDACIGAAGKLAAISKEHKGDAKAVAEKSLPAVKAAGFKDYGDYAAAQGQLLTGFVVFQQMQTLDKMEKNMGKSGPGAAVLKMSKGEMLKALRKNLKDLKLTEADLRLLHRKNRKLVDVFK